MAWRPYENLIDGELDNRVPGRVTGWMRFHRGRAKPLRVKFNLAGDFHDDIRGTRIRLHNPTPSDRAGATGKGPSYMDGFSPLQTGVVGDMTAGRSLGPWSTAIAERLSHEHDAALEASELSRTEREERRQKFAADCQSHIASGDLYYPYVDYPYLEWYSQRNGRVVLELNHEQLHVVEGETPAREQTPEERLAAREGREKALTTFLGDVARDLSRGASDDRSDQSVS
jgi:hypothetical protein